eukprot:CAMPEP_0194578298 /NCGR_PEP_ID=MMETSP0292-20121207/12764_1 /TAXON_ID=39354 /ORGANISM="Heterosigma akashiwo, Strain CCMP2393" /LENGTH=143 /DNA_ID=CAMNT_0039430909 /DNA_START=444 /DNA_END=875 /DNA_ORIENTATION=-
MVPANGAQSKGVHFCPSHEAVKCRYGQFGLGCAQMPRVRELARVRYQFDTQGWECPNLQLCTLKHWHATNTSKLPWTYNIVDRSEDWIEGGVGFGMGISVWAVLILHLWQRGSGVEGLRAGRAARRSGDSSVSRQISSSIDSL